MVIVAAVSRTDAGRRLGEVLGDAQITCPIYDSGADAEVCRDGRQADSAVYEFTPQTGTAAFTADGDCDWKIARAWLARELSKGIGIARRDRADGGQMPAAGGSSDVLERFMRGPAAEETRGGRRSPSSATGSA
jgi:hypothetical protein